MVMPEVGEKRYFSYDMAKAKNGIVAVVAWVGELQIGLKEGLDILD